MIRLDAGTGTAVWAVRVREARRIARTLSQLPGVRRAHGDPEAPWFVLLLPVPPAPVIAAMAASGHRGLEPLSPRLAELPGGIRVHPPVSGSDRWLQDAEAIIGGAVRHR